MESRPPGDARGVAARGIAARVRAAHSGPFLGDLIAAWGTRAGVLPDEFVEQLVSPEPTRHRVRRGGKSRYTYCALDALLLPFLEDAPAEVRTADARSGEEIEIELDSGGASRSSHPGIVVAVGAVFEPGGHAQACGCPYITAFTGRGSYNAWQRDHPEVVAVPLNLAQAVRLARLIAHAPEPAPPGDTADADRLITKTRV